MCCDGDFFLCLASVWTREAQRVADANIGKISQGFGCIPQGSPLPFATFREMLASGRDGSGNGSGVDAATVENWILHLK